MPQVLGNIISVPIYRPDEPWAMWADKDTYKGSDLPGRIVPKVKDVIVDLEGGGTSIVTSVDETTYLHEKEPFDMGYASRDPSIPPDNFFKDPHRVYVDYSKSPHVMVVDSTLLVSGSHFVYAKIFKGTEIYREGMCISVNYDSDGIVIDNKAGMETVAIDSHENHHVKVISPCNIHGDVDDGELVTIAMYTEDGVVGRKTTAIVELTNLLGDVAGDSHFVKDIRIVSPWLSETEPYTLIVPQGTPLDSLSISAIVTYKSGRTEEIVNDGVRLSILGLDLYDPVSRPREFDLIARYLVGREESGIDVVCDRYIPVAFHIRLIGMNNNPGVAIFPMIEWGANEKYILKWWLISADQALNTDVTEHVSVYEGPEFIGDLYNAWQSIKVKLNTIDVDGLDYTMIHVLDFVVRINKSENGVASINSDWVVSDLRDPSNEHEGYQNVWFERNDDCMFIAGASDYHEVLMKTHERLPMLSMFGVNITTEPTHVEIRSRDGGVEIIPVEEIMCSVLLDPPPRPTESIKLTFLYYDNGNRVYLSTTMVALR